MNNNISRQSSFSSLNAQSSLQDFEKWGDALKKTTKNLEGHKVTAQLTSNVNKTPYTVEDIIRISSNALKNLSEIYRNSSSEEQKQIYKTMADINNNTLNFIDQYEAQKTGSAFFTKHFKNIEKKMILGLFVKAAKKLYIQANYPQKLREQVNKATNEFITFSEQLLLKKSPTSVFSFSSFKEQLLDMNSANSIIEAMNTGIKSEFEVFKRLASDPNHGETTFERDTKVGQPFSIEESDREGTKKTYRLFPELNTLEKDKRIEKAKELVSSFITEQNKKWENTLQVLATQVAINPVEVAIGNWLTVNLHTNTSLIHTPLNADNYPEGTSLTNNNPAPELKIVRDTEGNITEVKVNIPMQYSLYNKQPDGEGVLIEDFMKANASFTVTLDDQNMPVISDFSYEIKSSNEYPGVDISLKSEDKN